jgi:hypothetical protein
MWDHDLHHECPLLDLAQKNTTHTIPSTERNAPPAYVSQTLRSLRVLWPKLPTVRQKKTKQVRWKQGEVRTKVQFGPTSLAWRTSPSHARRPGTVQPSAGRRRPQQRACACGDSYTRRAVLCCPNSKLIYINATPALLALDGGFKRIRSVLRSTKQSRN